MDCLFVSEFSLIIVGQVRVEGPKDLGETIIEHKVCNILIIC